MRKAANRYENEAVGLGEQFLNEVQARVDYLIKFPLAGKVIGDLRAISIKSVDLHPKVTH
jgi:hypothetical protein